MQSSIGAKVAAPPPPLPTHLYCGVGGGWGSLYRVAKIDLSTFTKVSTLTLSPYTEETGDIRVTGLLKKDSILYAVLNNYPNFVTKINLDTFTEVASIALASGDDEAYSDRPAVIMGDYLYIACGSGGRLVKIDLNTFTRVGALDYLGSELWSIATDETYLYTGDYAFFPGRIFKGRISDFSKVGTLTLGSGENYLRSMVIDEEGNYLYTTHFLSPARVVKVNLSTFTRESALTLDTGENQGTTMIIKGTDLYIGLTGKIVKIDLTTFTKTATLTLSVGESVLSFEICGDYLYAGLITSPAKIAKIDLTTFSEVAVLTLDSGENAACSLRSGTG
jgi:hypothetical protein